MHMPFFVEITHQLQAKTAPFSIALLMAGIMTGCQTTNLPNPNADAYPQVTSVQNNDLIFKPSSVSTPIELSKQTDTEQISTAQTDSKSIQTAPTQTEPVLIPSMPKPDDKTTQQLLLEQARQNSRQGHRPTTTSIQDGNSLPAFQKLMNTGVTQIRQGQLSAAQSTFTRAQRMAPQSSAVYFYLGQIALKQNQPLKAEAMARRGLVVAQTSDNKKALWQLILSSAETQGNTKVINEAKSALAH